MIDRDNQAPDSLEQAIAAFRSIPVSEGPPPQLEAATIEVLQSSARSHGDRLDKRRKLMFRIARYGSVAAAAVIVAGLAGWLFLLDRTAAHAFADVVENVKNAKSVTFVTKMPTIIQGTKKGTLRQKFYVQEDVYRMEIPSAQEDVQVPPDAPPIVAVLIADAKQHKVLMLDMVNKTASKIEADEKTWQEMAKAFADPIKQLRQLKDQDAERIGPALWEGKKTEVYRLKKTDIFMGMTVTPPEIAKLWVDLASGLPVRIAIERPADDGKVETIFSFEQFAWNDSFPPDWFKLEVPKGFTLKDK
jgi:outer membrane lipoprotein-sorting protein